MNQLRLQLAALLALLLLACAPPEDPNQLVITGSSTVAPLVSEIAKLYEAAHPDVRIDVQTGGSSRGIADARNGLADLGMVSRTLRAEESDLQAFVVARDGVAMIVHRDNPLDRLRDEDVVAIFTRQLTNWSELGGSDAPITVVNKAEGRATLAVFLEHFGLESPRIYADVIVGDNEQGIKTVAGNPDAIGYVSIGTAEIDRDRGVPIKLLATAGVEASRANVAEGSFPIARPLLLVSATKPRGLAADFLDFATTAQADAAIDAMAFVAPSR